MTKIVVDIEALQRMIDWLSMTAEDMSGTGKSLLRTTSDARSYDGQYAPWVQALAGEANHDIRTSADELNTLGQRLGCVAKAFEDADQAESVGDFAWALIMREMVERGEIPTGDWFVWRERFVRPPWISPEEWRLLTPEERRELVLEARKAYDAQNARIARMRTPPWEKDLGWLWNIAGLHPLLFEMEHFPDMEIDGIREYMNQLRQEYEQHWADFLANQAVYKFGVGDDLTEAFLIYMFGLEGAMQYGAAAIESSKGEFIGVIVAEDQRITEPFRERLSRDGINIIDLDRNAQDFNLNAIPGFENNNYGSNRMGEKGVHFNLCGQIGSALMMEVDPVEALIVFEGIPGGSDILENPHEGTNPNDLIALLAEYGWEGERVGYTGDPYPWRRFNGDSFRPKYEQIADHLLNGRGINALVNLDTGSDYIEPLDRTADAGHWSPILQVMTTRDDQQLVRLYNPYQDREEWYTFEHLVKSWTPSANYMAVVATPPEELRWLPNP